MSFSPAQPPQPLSTPTGYLRVLREQWPVVAFCVALCVAGGLLGQRLVSTSYSARSDLLISPIDNTDNTYVGISVFRSVSADPTSNVLTLARYLKTPATAELVRTRLHLRESADALLKSISVQPLSQTNIVSISASQKSPRLAAAVADAFAQATIARRSKQVQSDTGKVIARLQTQIGRSNPKSVTAVAALQARLAALRSLVGLPDPTVSVLNRAQIPTAPDKPSIKLVVIASVLAGLLLGFGVALLTDSVGGKIRREDDLLLRDRLPILARIPRLSPGVVRGYLAGTGNLPPAAWEAYRTLRTNILRSTQPGHTPVVLVTSAMTGDGKTFTALNLAVTLAAQDMEVLLVDGDFRRPMIASIFRIPPPKDGFASFIEGDVEAAISDVPGYPNLRALLPTLSNMTEIDQLDAGRARNLFARLRAVADIVVVDSAPATEVSDALLLASAADITLIAVRLRHTRRRQFDALRDSLAQYGVSVSGLVVTTRDAPTSVGRGSTMPVPLESKAPRRLRRDSPAQAEGQKTSK
jgi:Mrp family chromosome partitioning ATPase/capsular polysaccharide biosynthesis protein